MSRPPLEPSRPEEEGSAPGACPSCHAPLAQGAVLCVQCGYHVALGVTLATQVETTPRDATSRSANPFADGAGGPQASTIANPYAAPVAASAPALAARKRSSKPEFDLSEAGAAHARALVFESEIVPYVIPLTACFCPPVALLLAPYYGLRLWNWYGLNLRYAELASPNAFSSHAALATKFQDARPRLIAGTVVGVIWWVIALPLLLARLPAFLNWISGT